MNRAVVHGGRPAQEVGIGEQKRAAAALDEGQRPACRVGIVGQQSGERGVRIDRHAQSTRAAAITGDHSAGSAEGSTVGLDHHVERAAVDRQRGNGGAERGIVAELHNPSLIVVPPAKLLAVLIVNMPEPLLVKLPDVIP